jgi:hypothetical protein
MGSLPKKVNNVLYITQFLGVENSSATLYKSRHIFSQLETVVLNPDVLKKKKKDRADACAAAAIFIEIQSAKIVVFAVSRRLSSSMDVLQHCRRLCGINLSSFTADANFLK